MDSPIFGQWIIDPKMIGAFIKSLLPVAEGDLIFNVGLKDGRLAPEFGVDFARIPGRQMVN